MDEEAIKAIAEWIPSVRDQFGNWNRDFVPGAKKLVERFKLSPAFPTPEGFGDWHQHLKAAVLKENSDS